MKKLFSILLFLTLTAFTANAAESDAEFMDEGFFKKLSSLRPIERDAYFTACVNKVVSGKASVLSFDKTMRYKKPIRLILRDKAADSLKLTVIYNVFLKNEETVSVLVTGDDFEFRGQLLSVTPANTSRTFYIADIVLEEGVLILK